MEIKLAKYIRVIFSKPEELERIESILNKPGIREKIYCSSSFKEILIPTERVDLLYFLFRKGLSFSIFNSESELPSVELLYIEILRLNQLLQIAIKDLCELTGESEKDYYHDLSSRDYFEEISE